MSGTVLYIVWCDGDGCRAWKGADTLWEARDAARSAGWTCGKNMNSRDLCPEHAPAAPTTNRSVEGRS